MLQDSSNTNNSVPAPRRRKWRMLAIMPVWVVASFYAAQLLVGLIVTLLRVFHVPVESLNTNVFSAILALILYALTLAIVVGVPWLTNKDRSSTEELGVHRLPTWTDILMAPAGAVVYFLLSALLVYLATTLLPQINTNQVQDTGFAHLSQNYEYILAFATLVVLAPVAEEILFRGYLLGRLIKFVPVWASVLVVSLLFAFFHISGDLTHVDWSLFIDTFSLSIILCLLRLSTGSVWASILLHMIKNGVAFYILFVNPILTSTIGG